ncbi:MAG TPA: acetyl-CoA acetyltransferase [Anaerohalosphaeraceae bacterium]|nr:acetyl-CoA acetyltransferase [Anaerohalosphaeraceae bacterium]HOL89385.1 acetyl-CoA acetyltransferase [Anaerohalosphaeraceae bacterium]HPP54952.1 acetyl-CoA acetyltransferase [Anaerohalosphaeraceae bacterium]
MSRENVYLLGGYQTDFARNWARENKHISAMMREAYEGSLAVTRIEPRDIQAAFIGNFAAELYCMQGHLGAFFVDFDPAFRGLPTCRFEGACASSALAALSAMAHIQAGLYDCIAVVGVEQMKTVSPAKGGDYLGTAAWYERESAGIEFPFPKLFGKLGDVYEARYGLDNRHLARIAAINYANAKLNPNAQTRDWFMDYNHACRTGQYNTAIVGRIKVTDCSQVTDGAVCIYLASERFAAEYARRLGQTPAALPRILGWGHTTAPMEFVTKVAESEGQPYVLPWTRKAITDAYRRAGLKDCWDLDAIETHDCFTTSEYMAIDHFGLTEPGQSWKAIEEGVIEMGGRLPINPSGGLIGCGHPVGATGARQLLDAYKQVTETAGDYQVPGARRVATLNIGGSATTNVVFIVGR